MKGIIIYYHHFFHNKFFLQRTEVINKSCWFHRIGVDGWLRVPSVEDVFALGDCAGFLEQTGRPVLPALAQVSILLVL